ncbi:MAG: mucoidy inhibitor MuiA family protein [Candidatus Aminicenantes bacterium]|jgi:uncharacterized protein (TIGR02231 family)
MKEIEVKTAVDQVTVYVDRARISRKGNVSPDPGSHQLAVPDLPLTLDPDSVRVKAAGTARAKILGVDVKKTFFKDVPPGKAKELTDQIQQLEDEDRVLADNVQSVSGQIKHLDGLADSTKTFAVSLAKGKATTESHSSIIDFLLEKRMSAQEKLRKYTVERRELDQKLKKLKKELEQVRDLKPRERYSAVVEIEVLQKGELDIELIYTLPGAYWKPIYDIRLLEPDMEINYMGQVSQSTGEDWHDIKLILSTVPPTSGMGVPELHPWYIAPLRVSRPMGRAKFGAGTAEYAAAPAPSVDVAMAAEAEDLEEVLAEVEEAKFTTAEIDRSGASVTYSIGNRINIPGDGSPHKAMITYLKFSPQIDFVTAPKKESKAYRRVKVDNESDLMLLPGLAQIFEKEDFIGKAALKLVAPGEKIKFYAGTDERIRVERKLVKRETDKKFLADKRRIRYSYEIKLENHTGKEQNITVRDQIPLSRHESIKVKLEDVEPKENKLDGLNRLKWEIKLPDKEKKKIIYEFFIEYPRDMNVQGLP